MSWFKILKNTYNALDENPVIEYVKPPMRRRIDLDFLENSINSGETIYVNLLDKKVNTYVNAELEVASSEDSYIVVYEDEADPTYFVPVKSRVIDNVIFFDVVEDIPSGVSTSKYYMIYYGLDNTKYIEIINLDGELVFKQISDEDISTAEEGSYYDLSLSDTQNAFYTATTNSEKSFQLALYSNGTDWVDNYSKNIGAKAFGFFDGPILLLSGKSGPDMGKFRIRVFEVDEFNNITKTTAVDWTVVDCYNSVTNEYDTLFYKADFNYSRYMFEIESLSEKNVMSSSNSVNIKQYTFYPDYKLSYSKEEINPDIPFIRIGGIR